MHKSKVHTHGDLIFVRSVNGRARAYEVQSDGSLVETHPGTARAMQEARDIAHADAIHVTQETN